MNQLDPEAHRGEFRGSVGFLVGVNAGLAAAIVALAIRALFGVLSPPEMTVDLATALMPAPLFELGLKLLGFNAKPLLVLALAALEVLAAGLGGWLFAHWRTGDRSGAPLGPDVIPVLVVTTLFAELGFLPATGDGLLGVNSVDGPVRHLLAALVVNAVYAWVLVRTLRGYRFEARTPGEWERADQRARRRLLAQAAGGVALLLLGGVALRSTPISLIVGSPGQARRRSEDGLPPEVTPTADFYTVSKNFSDPVVDEAKWQLQVDGLVEQPLSFTYEQLVALPAVEQHTTLCCISNEVGGDLIGNALWRGVRLKTLLDMAKPKPGVRKVIFHGADDYQDSVRWEVADREANLLAWEMNGERLPPAHGFPARLLIPNIYGMKNVKWLTRIELVDFDFQGYWQQRGWSDEAVVKTTSRIDVPTHLTTLPSGPIGAQRRIDGRFEESVQRATIDPGSALAGGIAFAGMRGITRVEISIDGGDTWHPATVKRALSPFSWVLWTAEWPATVGRHSLRVRAVDGTGEVQTSQPADPLPDGASGHHEVVVRVLGNE
ncbi:MAG: molybdopterin-dependent oxidoreductase [Chloroflexi bacterium]|nr:molybdopterin-dependent oxidoreductase [Chloroflexota bacterium]